MALPLFALQICLIIWKSFEKERHCEERSDVAISGWNGANKPEEIATGLRPSQ